MNSYLFVCLFVVAIGFADADEPERIVGGENAARGEFPYTVSIRQRGSHFCGGAIIGPRHILTAAHCLFPLKGFGYDNIAVVTGTNNVNSGGESHRVAEMYYTQGYPQSHDWHNDVGIIKLAAPINFNAAQQPIELPTSPLPAESNVVVSGWGLTQKDGESPIHLQKIILRSIKREDCQNYYRRIPILESMICTLRNVNFGTCSGDSGGPLAFGNQVYGVVSGGIPCARGMPDVFTSVFHHLEFIRQAMTY